MDRKISKSQDKRIMKKERKLRLMLESNRGLNFSSVPTCYVLIGGGGLANHVSREDMEQITTDLDGLLHLEMPETETFCYAVFTSASFAAEARCRVSGFQLLTPRLPQRPTVQLTALFLSEIPEAAKNVPVSSQLPEGLTLLENFLSPEEEVELMSSVSWTDDEAGDSLKHRAVRHFGYEFRYDTNNVDPDQPLSDDLPSASTPLLQRLYSAGYIAELPDQLTVNRYEPGHGIPPHVDTHSAFGEALVSVSCSAQIVMDFRAPQGSRKVSVLLPRRSALILVGAARYEWSHGIAARRADLVVDKNGAPTLVPRSLRISFTFRKVRNPPECRCAFPDHCDFAKATAAAAVLAASSVPNLPEPTTDVSAVDVESRFVHNVYDSIADHFSATRHSPWPRVAAFLAGLTPGSIVADVGCGNGKYLGVNRDLLFLASDRSPQLCAICQNRHIGTSLAGVAVADVLRLPYRDATLDDVICVAVLHHLASVERRLAAVTELARVVRPGGRILITAWAFEQEEESGGSRSYVKAGREAREGLIGDFPLPVHTNRTAFREKDMLVPWHKKKDETLYRFYHLFSAGELDELCEETGSLIIEESYYDKGNWGIVAERLP